MAVVSMKSHFESLTDPRRKESTYPLINIVTMALCAVVCGADDFVAMAAWANQKKEWLSRFLDLSAGVPSHDQFNAIFRALKPEEFEQCLLKWTTALHEVSEGQIIAIDGKTLRRSYDKASSKSAIHMVSQVGCIKCTIMWAHNSTYNGAFHAPYTNPYTHIWI